MQLIGRTDSERKPVVLTPWSLVHLVVGAATKQYISFWTAELLHAAYEIVGSQQVFNSLGFDVHEKSSVVNSVGDQLVFTLGRNLPSSRLWSLVAVGIAFGFTRVGVEF